MPNTGPKLAGTGTGVGWTSPANVASPTNYATQTIAHGATTAPLRGSNFGFAVPAGATINGVQVSAVAFADSNLELLFSSIQLVKSGAATGTPKSDTAKWTDFPRGYNYGSSIDLWGATLTPADVNDPTFGFEAIVRNTSTEADMASVNDYLMTVFYTTGGGGGGGGATPSNGGTTEPLGLALFPATQGIVGTIYKLDPVNFNDPNSPSHYNFKVEDVLCGRNPTINRLFISHHDLGLANIVVTISGNNDSREVVSNSFPMVLGTALATGKIVTSVWDQISMTGQNLQLSIYRAAGAGPVSITKIRIEGTVER